MLFIVPSRKLSFDELLLQVWFGPDPTEQKSTRNEYNLTEQHFKLINFTVNIKLIENLTPKKHFKNNLNKLDCNRNGWNANILYFIIILF